ncbi:MAG: hypothetical protein ACRC1T_09385 [Clostridium chrysemydis]|uniref:hypothetical protein n=1 Tax=Clostridium chrysemydis TaxID=2665504 RepID=UPI003F3A1801
MRDKHLEHFRKTNLTEEDIRNFCKGNYEKHSISVLHGELKIIIEDGVPTITYLTDSAVLLETLSTNSLRLLAFNKNMEVK